MNDFLFGLYLFSLPFAIAFIIFFIITHFWPDKEEGECEHKWTIYPKDKSPIKKDIQICDKCAKIEVK